MRPLNSSQTPQTRSVFPLNPTPQTLCQKENKWLKVLTPFTQSLLTSLEVSHSQAFGTTESCTLIPASSDHFSIPISHFISLTRNTSHGEDVNSRQHKVFQELVSIGSVEEGHFAGGVGPSSHPQLRAAGRATLWGILKGNEEKGQEKAGTHKPIFKPGNGATCSS